QTLSAGWDLGIVDLRSWRTCDLCAGSWRQAVSPRHIQLYQTYGSAPGDVDVRCEQPRPMRSETCHDEYAAAGADYDERSHGTGGFARDGRAIDAGRPFSGRTHCESSATYSLQKGRGKRSGDSRTTLQGGAA